MRKTSRSIANLMVFYAFFFLSVLGRGFAEDKGGDLKVLEVNVVGNRAISETTILAKIKTKPGTVFSQDVTNEDIKRLYAMGFFSDVEFNAKTVADGIILEVIVEEKPVVREVEIRGNKKLRSGRLRKVMKTLANQILDYSQLTTDIEEIRNLYEEKGFANVSVEYDVEINEITNTADVIIDIIESKVVKINKISLRGNYSFPDKTLFKLIKTRKDTLFTSGVFKSEVFEGDIENLKRFYRNKGYLDVDITHYFDYLNEGRRMIVNIIIEEGDAYLTGDVAVEGAEVIAESELRSHLKMVTDTPFSELNLRTDALTLRDLY